MPFAAPVVLQVLQPSTLAKDTSLRQPKAASSKSMVTLANISSPSWGIFLALARELPLPPKNDEARDIVVFNKYGYFCDSVTPFDLFPATGHVESVVCLTRQSDVI